MKRILTVPKDRLFVLTLLIAMIAVLLPRPAFCTLTVDDLNDALSDWQDDYSYTDDSYWAEVFYHRTTLFEEYSSGVYIGLKSIVTADPDYFKTNLESILNMTTANLGSESRLTVLRFCLELGISSLNTILETHLSSNYADEVRTFAASYRIGANPTTAKPILLNNLAFTSLDSVSWASLESDIAAIISTGDTQAKFLAASYYDSRDATATELLDASIEILDLSTTGIAVTSTQLMAINVVFNANESNVVEDIEKALESSSPVVRHHAMNRLISLAANGNADAEEDLEDMAENSTIENDVRDMAEYFVQVQLNATAAVGDYRHVDQILGTERATPYNPGVAVEFISPSGIWARHVADWIPTYYRSQYDDDGLQMDRNYHDVWLSHVINNAGIQLCQGNDDCTEEDVHQWINGDAIYGPLSEWGHLTTFPDAYVGQGGSQHNVVARRNETGTIDEVLRTMADWCNVIQLDVPVDSTLDIVRAGDIICYYFKPVNGEPYWRTFIIRNDCLDNNENNPGAGVYLTGMGTNRQRDYTTLSRINTRANQNNFDTEACFKDRFSLAQSRCLPLGAQVNQKVSTSRDQSTSTSK
ncbi:MAG: hypothetical protein P9X24_08525 [Candidatus Hatepunaea meridiana]|nr:hypothetical protein [Candidatus Hatepunaea meridiana]